MMPPSPDDALALLPSPCGWHLTFNRPLESLVCTCPALNFDLHAGSYQPRFVARAGFNNRLTVATAGPYLVFGLQTPTQLLGLNSSARPADGWPQSALGTTLSNAGAPTPTSYDSQTYGGKLRVNDWNDFALSVTRMPTDVVTVNGVARGCTETVKIEW